MSTKWKAIWTGVGIIVAATIIWLIWLIWLHEQDIRSGSPATGNNVVMNLVTNYVNGVPMQPLINNSPVFRPVFNQKVIINGGRVISSSTTDEDETNVSTTFNTSDENNPQLNIPRRSTIERLKNGEPFVIETWRVRAHSELSLWSDGSCLVDPQPNMTGRPLTLRYDGMVVQTTTNGNLQLPRSYGIGSQDGVKTIEVINDNDGQNIITFRISKIGR